MDFDFSISSMNEVLEFIVGASSAVVVIYGIFMRPIKKLFKKMEYLEQSANCVNKEILPVIKSLGGEFTKNGGKSIMDRILRIDDNTRLAELRSKLIASNLVTTSMCEFDRSGKLTWANKAFLSFTGLDLSSLQDNGWFVTIDEDVRERVWNLWNYSIHAGIPFESEFHIKNQVNGTVKNVKCTVYPHKSVDINSPNPILGYYGTFSEVLS